MGTNALHARSHLKATGLCKGVQEEVSGLSYALGNQTGMRLKVGFGRNEGSKNRCSRCWKPADKQDSLAPRFGPRGTAGGVSQVGNVDIVIRIRVLRVGSRLVVEAHIFTAGLQRRHMGPGRFRHLGTTKEASLDLGEVILAFPTVGSGGHAYSCSSRHRGG